MEWLIYSQFAVMLVLAYVWIPFVALPIFVSLNNLDGSLLEAAGDLGASRWRTFLRVTLPLSLPGLTAAFVFVFVPTIGEFVTPQIVGGSADGSNFLFGNAINARFTQALDWQSGSVMALFLLIVVAVLMAIFGRRIQMRTDGRPEMDLASSRGALWLLRVFFVLLVVFLYVPLLVLVVFSFNKGDVTFPLQGFTTSWYTRAARESRRWSRRCSAA